MQLPEVQYNAILSRGCTITPDHAFKQQLQSSYESKKPLCIKFGADPSRPDLHIGHAVVLNLLRLFQDLGHHVAFIIGDFTARIGDPTGQNQTRPALDNAIIQANARSYQDQVFKILKPENTTVYYNSTWLNTLDLNTLISWLSRVTLQQMLVRDDFSKRYAQQQPIQLHECLYPVLQAYDSVQLHADVECGGTDQTFNLLLGRAFQKIAGQSAQSVITLPILEGLDGTRKMSKSYGNAIGLTETADSIFGKLMSISDTLMYKYYTLLQPDLLPADYKTQPLAAKKRLARLITAQLHTPDSAQAAQAAFEAQVSRKEYPHDMPVYYCTRDILHWPDIIVDAGLLSSKKAVRRLLLQGGIKWNRIPQTHSNQDWDKTPGILQVGKRQFLKIIWHSQK